MVGQLKLGVVIAGNSARRRPNLSPAQAMAYTETWLVSTAREQGQREAYRGFTCTLR